MEIDINKESERLNRAYSFTDKLISKAKSAMIIRRRISDHYKKQGFEHIDTDTGEVTNQKVNLATLSKQQAELLFGDTKHAHIFNYWQRLGNNQTLFAVHNIGDLRRQQAIVTRYSMHSLCPLWSWRKSKILRKKFTRFFEENQSLFTNMTPCHLVLTLRHDEKGFFGRGQTKNKITCLEHVPEKFYARDLIKLFTEFRQINSDPKKRGTKFKEYFVGGTYNIECKKSQSGGMHIHMHCFALVPSDKLEDAEKWIKSQWYEFTGASQVHLERLYFWDYSEGEPIKRSYDPTWDYDKISHSIMECLKYTFKGDEIYTKDAKGKSVLDMEYLGEVLQESKYLRYFSKFGILYGVSALNFSHKEENTFNEDVENLYIEALEEFTKYTNFKEEAQILADKHNVSQQTIIDQIINIIDTKSMPKEHLFDFHLLPTVKDFEQPDTNLRKRLMEVINPITLQIDTNFELYLGIPAKQRHVNGYYIAEKKHLFKIHPKYKEVEQVPELCRNLYIFTPSLLSDYEKQRYYKYLNKLDDPPERGAPTLF